METTEDYAQDAGSEPEVQSAEKDGITYELDADGNHCLQGVPVLDPKGVSFRNRMSELDRKLESVDDKIAARVAEAENRYREELSRMRVEHVDMVSEEAFDPDAWNEDAGMTEGQLKTIEDRLVKTVSGLVNAQQSELAPLVIGNNIENQKDALRKKEDYIDFWSDPKFEQQLDAQLSTLDINVRSKPGIVENCMKLIIGDNLSEFRRLAVERERTRWSENRSIVGEIQSGRTSPMRTSKGHSVTAEVRRFARDNQMPVEEAAELIHYKNQKLAKSGGS